MIAEEAAHKHARSLVSEDYATFIRSLTPDALMKAMDMGNTSWKILSYDLTPQGQDGDDYLCLITFHTEKGPNKINYRFRQIDDEWRVVDLDSAD
jgi:hypothetical protein